MITLSVGKSPFIDAYIHRDNWYAEIFKPDEELDGKTISVLSVICPALVRYFRVAAKEHLPGGEFYNLTGEDVQGVPTNNKFVEKMFGYWKSLMVYMFAL